MERNTGLRNAWYMYVKLQLDDDFIQHLGFYLLSTPTVFFINNAVIRIVCDRFSQQGYQPKTEYHTNYTREFLTTDRLDEQTPLDRHELMTEAVDRSTTTSSPFLTTLLHEVVNHLNDDEVLLLIAEQLDAEDLARLKAESPEDILDLVKIYKDQRPMLSEWLRQYA